MAKLDLVLESVRDRYMINVLEEGTTELNALKTKRFLTESTQRIKEILIQEGVMDTVKSSVQNAYLKAKPFLTQKVDPRVMYGAAGAAGLASAAVGGLYGDEINQAASEAYDHVADLGHRAKMGYEAYNAQSTIDPTMDPKARLDGANYIAQNNDVDALKALKLAAANPAQHADAVGKFDAFKQEPYTKPNDEALKALSTIDPTMDPKARLEAAKYITQNNDVDALKALKLSAGRVSMGNEANKAMSAIDPTMDPKARTEGANYIVQNNDVDALKALKSMAANPAQHAK